MSSRQYFVSGVIFAATLLGVGAFNGYYEYHTQTCYFNPKNLSDVEFVMSKWFNKAIYIQFNSTKGRFEGYTALGVYTANNWNHKKAVLEYWQNKTNTYCKSNDQIDSDNILSKTVEPEVILSLGRPSTDDQPAVLMCSAYSFYPKMIRVTWYRDGQKVTGGDVISTEELADGDWYYQMHSNLQFTPKDGEKISCVVEHASLEGPKELVWEPPIMPEAEWKEIAGGTGLGLGFILAAAGYIYYRIRLANQEETTPLLGHGS